MHACMLTPFCSGSTAAVALCVCLTVVRLRSGGIDTPLCIALHVGCDDSEHVHHLGAGVADGHVHATRWRGERAGVAQWHSDTHEVNMSKRADRMRIRCDRRCQSRAATGGEDVAQSVVVSRFFGTAPLDGFHSVSAGSRDKLAPPSLFSACCACCMVSCADGVVSVTEPCALC